MNISGDGKMLSGATRDLMRRWSETKTYWDDKRSEDFERKFLAELSVIVERAGTAFDRLDKLVAGIKEQCE
jgi:hypothetical protein